MKSLSHLRLSTDARVFTAICAGLLLSLGACDQGGGLLNPPQDSTVATVTISAPGQTIQSGGTMQLTATAWNASGDALAGKEFRWKSGSDGVATVNSSGMLTTHRNGSVIITATSEGKSGTTTIEVTAAPVPASIAVAPTTVEFSGIAGQANPAAQSIAVTNAGGGTLSGLSTSISYGAGQPAGWLAATLNSTSAPATLTLQAAMGTLPAGSYSATVTIRSSLPGVAEKTVRVTFVLTAAPQPAIGVSPATVAFSTTVGQGNPAAQSVNITNSGTGTLTGLSTSISYAAGQPGGWLTATLSGTAAPATLTLQANSANLLPGTYSATVSVRSSLAGVSEQNVTVTLTVNAVAMPAPAAPSNLSASATGTQISLTWADNSNNETEFRIERKTGSGGNYAQIATTAANSTGYTDSGLANSTTYFYRIRACNAAGCSGYSNEASATTAQAAVAPAVQTGGASSVTQNSATVSGSVSPNGLATSVWFEWGTSGNLGSVTQQQSVGSGTGNQTISANLTNLAPGTTYFYRVAAQNSAGTSHGVVHSFTTGQAPVVVPSAPSNLEAKEAKDQIRLKWRDNSTNETEFRTERKEGQNGSWGQIGTAGANSTEYLDKDPNLRKGRTYFYRVRACNNAGCSGYSNEVSEKL